MICSNCGFENQPNSSSCHRCGRLLKASSLQQGSAQMRTIARQNTSSNLRWFQFFFGILLGCLLGFLASVVLIFHGHIQNNITVTPLSALLFIFLLIVMCRILIRNVFLITIGTIAFLISYLIITSIFFPSHDSLIRSIEIPQVFGISIFLLLFGFIVDLILKNGSRFGFLVEKITKPELVLIIILCMINIGIIFGSGYIPNMQIRLYVAWFYTLLIIMLCRLSIDKFGAISVYMVLFSFLFFPLLPTGWIPKESSNISIFQLMLNGIIFGFTIDIGLSLSRIRNVLHVLRGGRIGFSDTSYIALYGYLFRSIVFGIVASIILFFLTLESGLWKISSVFMAIGMGVSGGITSAMIFPRLDDSKILNIVRPWYEQVWTRSMDWWVSCVEIGDVDNDGQNELLVGSADFTLRCYKDDKEIWKVQLGNMMGAKCGIGDVDGDGKNEVIIGSYDGILRCLDGENGQQKWMVDDYNNWIWCSTIGDVDNDGINEVVTGDFENLIRCFKYGKEIWRAEFDSFLGCCAIGDIDNDGMNEVVVGGGVDSSIHIIKSGRVVGRVHIGEHFCALAIGDIDNDGTNEIVVGDWGTTIRCIKHNFWLDQR